MIKCTHASLVAMTPPPCFRSRGRDEATALTNSYQNRATKSPFHWDDMWWGARNKQLILVWQYSQVCEKCCFRDRSELALGSAINSSWPAQNFRGLSPQSLRRALLNQRVTRQNLRSSSEYPTSRNVSTSQVVKLAAAPEDISTTSGPT